MVWIATNPPLDADDTKLLKFLSRKVGVKSAKKTVLLFSLYKYLEANKLRTPKEIETSAYYDEAKTRPVFTSKVARSIANLMKQSGGAGDEAIVLDRAIRGMIGYIQSWLPSPITATINEVYSFATILKRFQEMPGVGPFIDIGKEAAVQLTKTAIVTADTVGAEVGGPVGEAAVAIPAAIATFAVVITHVLEDELGEAMLASFLAIPFIGPVLYRAAGSLGRFGRKVFEHKDTIVGTTRTFLGDGIADKVDYYIPNMDANKQGGKRFSTRRRRVSKWRRTRSVKH
jgi:hypothetical protein